MWAYDPGDPSATVLKVGHHHYLERLVDGMTEIEWLEHAINTRYVHEESEVDERIARGELTEADREEILAELMATINSEVRNLFGNPNEELDDYARRHK